MLANRLIKKRLTIIVSLFLCAFYYPVFGEILYRYQDDNGKWHFTNRAQTAPKVAEKTQYKAKLSLAIPEIIVRKNNGKKQVVAVNPYYGPVQAFVQFAYGLCNYVDVVVVLRTICIGICIKGR